MRQGRYYICCLSGGQEKPVESSKTLLGEKEEKSRQEIWFRTKLNELTSGLSLVYKTILSWTIYNMKIKVLVATLKTERVLLVISCFIYFLLPLIEFLGIRLWIVMNTLAAYCVPSESTHTHYHMMSMITYANKFTQHNFQIQKKNTVARRILHVKNAGAT